jgi:hypothetical protein
LDVDVDAVLAARVVAVGAAHAFHEIRVEKYGRIDSIDDGCAPSA